MKNLVITILAAAGLGSASLFATPAPSSAFVDSIKINGSGCGNVNIGWHQFGPLHLSVKTPGYFVDLTHNSRIERKNCQAMVDIVKPDGWTYRVKAVHLSGFAHISGGAEASVTNWHYIQGQAATSRSEYNVDPWIRSDFYISNDEKGEWSPCGLDRVLNINTAIMVRRDQDTHGNAFVKLNPNMHVQLEWRRCY